MKSLAFILAAFVVGIASAQTVVNSTWLYGNGKYSDPANWSPAEVPNNTPDRNYNVTATIQLRLDMNATVSNLSASRLLSEGFSYTVAGNSELGSLFLASTTPAGATFNTAALASFSNGSLSGSYYIADYNDSAGWATLQFNGANIIRLQSADVSLVFPMTRIIDENGADALRNLAEIDSASSLTMVGHQFTTSANVFTNDGALSISSGFNEPGVFVISGSLSNFDAATKTLKNGTYFVGGGGFYSGDSVPSRIQFPAADIVNSGASMSIGAGGAISDELGRDALRNFAHNLSTGVFTPSPHFITAGDFTNDGTLSASSFVVSGRLTNFDAATKTLNGGTYRLSGAAGPFQFSGADIVRNNATLEISDSSPSSPAISDENGNDALGNFAENLAGGTFSLGDAMPFTVQSDFLNEGTVQLQGGETYVATINIPSGHAYHQTSGVTKLLAGGFDGDVVIDGGELNVAGGGFGFLQASRMTGNLMMRGGALELGLFNITGSAAFSGSATLRYTADEPGAVNIGLQVSDTLTLGGNVAVEYPDRFPPGSGTPFVVAAARTLNGQFANAPFGSRITTTDGAGSFLVTTISYNGQTEVALVDYQRAVPASQLMNISTRAEVLTGDNVAIGGFIVTGADPKRVIIRAIGPSLADRGVSGALQDPVIELHDSKGALIATNDNWSDTQAREVIDSGLAPSDFRESAIVATLQRGSYTAVVRGKNDTTGVALVEVYDLANDAKAKLANISTRGFVDANNPLIGGFIGGGNAQGNAEIVVRAIGPELKSRKVTNYLADPTLEVRNADGALIVANDDHATPEENEQTMPVSLYLIDPADAATGLVLSPAKYTVIVRGKNGASGNALVEIYDLNG